MFTCSHTVKEEASFIFKFNAIKKNPIVLSIVSISGSTVPQTAGALTSGSISHIDAGL